MLQCKSTRIKRQQAISINLVQVFIKTRPNASFHLCWVWNLRRTLILPQYSQKAYIKKLGFGKNCSTLLRRQINNFSISNISINILRGSKFFVIECVWQWLCTSLNNFSALGCILEINAMLKTKSWTRSENFT
jgi:hypothetical protein